MEYRIRNERDGKTACAQEDEKRVRSEGRVEKCLFRRVRNGKEVERECKTNRCLIERTAQ